MLVPVRYTLYFWNPPILTPEQEVEAGRQIVLTGGPEAWKKKAPYLPEERTRAEAYASTKRTARQIILAVIGLLGFLRPRWAEALDSSRHRVRDYCAP